MKREARIGKMKVKALLLTVVILFESAFAGIGPVNAQTVSENEFGTVEESVSKNSAVEEESSEVATEEVQAVGDSAEEPKILDSGIDGKVEWSIDEYGHLLLMGEGDYEGNPDWTDVEYRSEIKTATVQVKNMTSAYMMFDGCNNLKSVDFSQFDSSKVTNMYKMFQNCRSLIDPDLKNLNTSNVTTMYGMFYYCDKLTKADFSNFRTENVTNMGNMFYACHSLYALDLSKFDTGNVTSMRGMFSYCYYLEDLDVSNFKTGNVTDMRNMFYCLCRIRDLDLSKWDLSSLEQADEMFYTSSVVTWKLPNLPIDISLTDEYVDETNQVTNVAKANVGIMTYVRKDYARSHCGMNGHTYDKPLFIWTADYKEVNVNFVCMKEECFYNNKITVPAVITVQTVSPTSEKEGAIIYTAAVVFGGKTYTDVRSVAIPKLPTQQQEPQPQEPAPQQQPTVQPTAKPVGTSLKSSGIVYCVTKAGKTPEVAYAKPKSKKVKTVTIPASVKIDGITYKVTSVADNALKNCKKVTKVTVGKNVTQIGKNAFYGCTKLNKIVIKTKKLKSVGKNAIKGIKKKATIDVPNSKKKTYKKLFTGKTGYKKTMQIK